MEAEDYQDLRYEGRAEKMAKQKFNSELCQFIAAECGYDLEMIADYHIRLTIRKLKLDYFPQSGKAVWLKKGKYFMIDDIEMFLESELKNK